MTKPLEPEALIAKAEELMKATTRRRTEGQQRVLAIGAHPDDVEIGVGGILLRHRDAGDEVSILTLTGGEHGGLAKERALESERAAELISARLFHASLPDMSVTDGGETITEIKRVIDETRPTTIYTHTPRDVHQDHRNAHHATLVAAREVPRVLCYQAPSSTVDFRPTRFVSVDVFLERKLEAIRAYRSQVEIRAYLDEELLRSTARYWAHFANCRYAEPLEVVRDADLSEPAERGGPRRSPARSCPMLDGGPAAGGRVLITGAGGPSGYCMLRNLAEAGRALRVARRPTSIPAPRACTRSSRSGGSSCRAATIPGSPRSRSSGAPSSASTCSCRRSTAS